MALPARKLFDELDRRFGSIDRIRKKVAKLHTKGRVNSREAHLLVESLYLNAHSGFENFLERLFVGLVTSSYKSTIPGVKPKVPFKSSAMARQYILGPRRKYMDWLPYDKTTEMAAIYLRGGKPFSVLSQAEKDVIAKSVAIRNDIAHKTKSTHEKFLTIVIGTTVIPTQERQPAGYLLGVYRHTPTPQTRFELYLSQLRTIAQNLAK